MKEERKVGGRWVGRAARLETSNQRVEEDWENEQKLAGGGRHSLYMTEIWDVGGPREFMRLTLAEKPSYGE